MNFAPISEFVTRNWLFTLMFVALVFAAAKYRTQRMLHESFGSLKSKEEYEDFKLKVIGDLDKHFNEVTLPDSPANLIDHSSHIQIKILSGGFKANWDSEEIVIKI